MKSYAYSYSVKNYVEYTETILFSYKPSTFCIKSNFVYEIIGPSFLNILTGTGPFSINKTRSMGTFLKEFVARSL